MRARTLFAAAVVLAVVAGCAPWPDERGVAVRATVACVPHTPAHPLALSWIENVDDQLAFSVGFAPPTLQITSDGQVVANALRQTKLTAAQLHTLLARVRDDLAATRSVVQLQNSDPNQTTESIELWRPGTPVLRREAIYQPGPYHPYSTSAPPVSPGAHQALDAQMPAALKDAVDQLDALLHDTMAHGTPYHSPRIDVLVVDQDADVIEQLTNGAPSAPQQPSDRKVTWPVGLPTVRAYTPGESSGYGIQHLDVPAAASPQAERAFPEYLQKGATITAYDDGIAGQHYAWYGVWRPLAPTEADSSIIPVVCATPAPKKTPTPTR